MQYVDQAMYTVFPLNTAKAYMYISRPMIVADVHSNFHVVVTFAIFAQSRSNLTLVGAAS